MILSFFATLTPLGVPLTPFIGRIALELFGPSIAGIRFFSGLAQALAPVLTGLMARELGGKRCAVTLAGLAVWIVPVSFAHVIISAS